MQEQMIVILITVPSVPIGEQIAKDLVGRKLAACVNQAGAVKSIYEWKGEVQRDEEVLLIVKSRLALFDQLASAVKAIHPYEVPEIIALPILAGSADYIEWMKESTQ